jgi:hypothetical protein
MNVTFTNTELTAGTVEARNFTISAAGKIWVNRARPSKAAEAAIHSARAKAELATTAKFAAKAKAAVAQVSAHAAKATQELAVSEHSAPVAAEVKLIVLVKANPKREGCAAYERFSAYFSKKVKTVGDALEAGLTRKDIAWDMNHGYIQLAA